MCFAEGTSALFPLVSGDVYQNKRRSGDSVSLGNVGLLRPSQKQTLTLQRDVMYNNSLFCCIIRFTTNSCYFKTFLTRSAPGEKYEKSSVCSEKW